METVTELKRGTDFRELVARSHQFGKNYKIHCPFHQDEHPSCHIYPDGFKCFGCGVYGDHIDWLVHLYAFSTSEAIAYLREGKPVRAFRGVAQKQASGYSPISAEALKSYKSRLRNTTKVPEALLGRGLSLDEVRGLGIAALNQDALLPIFGPDGDILALKRRFYHMEYRESQQRYSYLTVGHGSPAWCSSGVRRSPNLLIMEGELNAMVSHLALQEAGVEVELMGVAGTHGGLHKSVLKAKAIYLYADDDQAGRQAISRWHRLARQAGAKSIITLKPFEKDACEIAHEAGRLFLASQLLSRMFVKPARKYRAAVIDRMAA